MTIFDRESIEFLSRRITRTEAKQFAAWASAELNNRVVAADDFDARILLQIVASRVSDALTFLLGQSSAESLHDGPLFVQYYAALLRAANSDATKEEREHTMSKMREKIERRETQRTAFLRDILGEIRFSQLADWYTRVGKGTLPTLSLLQFDLIVETFIDHTVQQVLEKGLQRVVFPKIKLH